MEEKKVRFRDLSMPLKAAIVLAWCVGVIYALSLFAGILIGAMSEV